MQKLLNGEFLQFPHLARFLAFYLCKLSKIHKILQSNSATQMNLQNFIIITKPYPRILLVVRILYLVTKIRTQIYAKSAVNKAFAKSYPQI